MPKPAYRALEMIAEQVTAPGATAARVAGGTPLLNVAGAVVGATAGTVDVSASTAAPPAGGGDAAASLPVTVLLANFNVSSAAPPAAATVTLVFSAPAAAAAGAWPASATLEVVDATHTNPMAVWEAAGSPLYPPESEIASELAASALQPQQVAIDPATHAVNVTLPPYAFARLTFALSVA